MILDIRPLSFQAFTIADSDRYDNVDNKSECEMESSDAVKRLSSPDEERWSLTFGRLIVILGFVPDYLFRFQSHDPRSQFFLGVSSRCRRVNMNETVELESTESREKARVVKCRTWPVESCIGLAIAFFHNISMGRDD